MKNFRTAVAALTLAGFVMADARTARADTYGDAAAGDAAACTTTWIVVPLLTTTAVVILIYFLVIRSSPAKTASNGQEASPPPPPPAAPGALMYLRDVGPELAQNLAEGRGQTFVDFADALEIPAAHRPAFAKALRGHRAKLLDLADPAKLTEARSVEFLSEVVAAMREDQTLTADLSAWTSHMAARLQAT